MTTEALATIGQLVEKYGLPLVLLGVFLWLVLTRRFVTGNELQYVEERRKEERVDKLATLEVVRELTTSVDKLSDAMEQFLDSVVTAVEDAIDREPPRGPRR